MSPSGSQLENIEETFRNFSRDGCGELKGRPSEEVVNYNTLENIRYSVEFSDAEKIRTSRSTGTLTSF
jgi:hypothetical protein